ncbi:MAG: DUF5615 family PIN-like protein [Thermoanaerobaculales bacterium]|nr:DUF5615 family PIN-like protein [Thermoanaerobaculales bacterium]
MFLPGMGNDVYWIRRQCPGVSDLTLVDLATRDNRLILTFDKDFGGLPSIEAWHRLPASFCSESRCQERSRLPELFLGLLWSMSRDVTYFMLDIEESWTGSLITPRA